MEQLPLLGRVPSEAELRIRSDPKICDELTRLMAEALEAIYRMQKGAPAEGLGAGKQGVQHIDDG